MTASEGRSGERCAAAIACALLPSLAHAHAGPQPLGGGLHWSFDPWVVVPLAIALVAYILGLVRLWRRSGPGRGIGRWRAASWLAGWAVTAAALVSPLDALGAHLFAAHMVQHELLMVVAAPLLVIGKPLAAWTWALPRRARRGAGAVTRGRLFACAWAALTSARSSWVLHALALWVWHLPSLFQRALVDDGLHTLQHLSFLGTALLFWWAVIGRVHRGGNTLGGLLYLFTTMLHTGVLGALLTLSPFVWYPRYEETAGAFGFDALADQQLGGLIMWIPAGVAYPVAALVLVGLALSPRRSRPDALVTSVARS